jgi:FlaA1/EpsC-like NDP-sugar epimerase
MIREYEITVTGRDKSLYEEDLIGNEGTLRELLHGSRVVIIGAAGSIGAAVVKTVLRFSPRTLALTDLSENNLVELVRDLRSSRALRLPAGFEALPIGLGSVECARYFQDSPPFDYLLNLSALKHVRSEKNIYCLMRMLDTNVVFLHDFLRDNPYRFRKVFSVSSDKAANPANLMGASKMIMEQMLLAHAREQPFSTARFANVAFSDGSLPYGFLRRIEKGQPISAPKDIKRYFISHREAGELSVLACMLGENCDAFFPKFADGKGDKTFSQIAVDLLKALGYEPVECDSEEEAKSRAEELIRQRRWPCYFFKSDTTGEKECEEFCVEGEEVDTDRFRNIGVAKRSPLIDAERVDTFIQFCRRAKSNPKVAKDDYIQAMLKVVPTLRHIETGKNLDQKM